MKTFDFAIIANDYKKTKNIAIQLKNKLTKLSCKENLLNPEIVFVIGGDGTFLKAVNYFNQVIDKVKFVNFKQGKVSFYHSFAIEEIDNVVKKIFLEHKDFFYVNELDLLEVKFNNQIKYAINEVRFFNFFQTVQFQILINNQLLQVFKGSGIIVSTKTGSTGLMKAANGAVILSNLKLMQYQEIFPVNNNYYNSIKNPVILDNSQELKLVITDNKDSEFSNQLVVDTFNFRDKLIKEVKFKLSNKTLKIISYEKQEDNLISKINKTFVNFEEEN